MAVNRYYSATASDTTLTNSATASDATIVVGATTGFPGSYPYTLALDYGVSGEELVDVTGASGTTLSITRATDGTTAKTHTIGAVVRHVLTARDIREAQNHIAATGAVHGLTGAIVGNSDAQTLTNKTITSPIISTIVNTGTLTLPTATDTLVARTTTDTLSNKTLKSPREFTTISATAATGTINFDAVTQGTLYYTANASANWTLNVRGDGSTTLNSLMATGETITIAFLATQGTTAYYPSAFTIDSTSVTPKWQGGSAPSAGNVSSIDAYLITIIKTGSATYTVIGSQTKFA
jgi:hypothetical protein